MWNVQNIEGSSFDDILVGSSPGLNSIFGGGGDDRLFGLDGDDELFGEDGTDRASGGPGAGDFCAAESKSGCES